MSPAFSLDDGSRLWVGWPLGPGTSDSGIFSTTPAVYYEGIAFPLNPDLLSSWLPATGTVLLSEIPVQALLGPVRGQTAFLVQGPTFEEDRGSFSVLSGTGGNSRVALREHQSMFSIDGMVEHGEGIGLTPLDSWMVNGDFKSEEASPIRADGGILGAQWMGRGDWFAAFSRIKLDLADFQEIVWRPYVQRADQDGDSVQQFGNELNYHLNMAGLLECQLTGGWDRSESQNGSVLPSENHEFVQNTDLIDVLGMANVVFAFREDFSDLADPFSNFLVGLKGRLTDDWILYGDLQTAAWTAGIGDRTGDIGFDQSFDPKFSIKYGYTYQRVGSTFWNGGKLTVTWNRGIVPLINRPLSFEASGEGLWDANGNPEWDWGGRIFWGFYQGWSGWFGGRKTADQPWWTEIGMNIPWSDHLRSIISVSNLSGLSTPGVGLYGPSGTGVLVGVEGEF